MLNRIKLFICLLLSIVFLYGNKSITIKVFHVFESFGTETQELKNSIVMEYDSMGWLIDSSIYSHTIPLNQKYVYVSGPQNEGLKIKRSYAKEMVLSYSFVNDKNGNRISTTLTGPGDSIYWKEYQKYDLNNNIIKRIRYNPKKAINTNMMTENNEGEKMLWGESYNYDSTGKILECKELYNNYALVITTFGLDSLNITKKINQYFDPSVIFQTIYFHNQKGELIEESSTGRFGNLIESKTYEYDILGRRVATTIYNEKGKIKEIYNTLFDDDNFKTFDFYSDSTVKLSSLREVILDNKGRKYIEAILDSDERVLEKNVYYYDIKGRISEVKQYDLIRRKKSQNKEIPVRVNIYEYN